MRQCNHDCIGKCGRVERERERGGERQRQRQMQRQRQKHSERKRENTREREKWSEIDMRKIGRWCERERERESATLYHWGIWQWRWQTVTYSNIVALHLPWWLLVFQTDGQNEAGAGSTASDRRLGASSAAGRGAGGIDLGFGSTAKEAPHPQLKRKPTMCRAQPDWMEDCVRNLAQLYSNTIYYIYI